MTDVRLNSWLFVISLVCYAAHWTQNPNTPGSADSHDSGLLVDVNGELFLAMGHERNYPMSPHSGYFVDAWVFGMAASFFVLTDM